MEEDIKVLEDYAYTMCTISCTTEKDQRIAQAIENLIKGYKELEEENKINNRIIKDSESRIEARYIPKSKVREKIEEIKKVGKVKNNTFATFGQYIYQEQIDVLQELLEERN